MTRLLILPLALAGLALFSIFGKRKDFHYE